LDLFLWNLVGFFLRLLPLFHTVTIKHAHIRSNRTLQAAWRQEVSEGQKGPKAEAQEDTEVAAATPAATAGRSACAVNHRKLNIFCFHFKYLKSPSKAFFV